VIGIVLHAATCSLPGTQIAECVEDPNQSMGTAVQWRWVWVVADRGVAPGAVEVIAAASSMRTIWPLCCIYELAECMRIH